jgi:SAM-dependent methyltransferase
MKKFLGIVSLIFIQQICFTENIPSHVILSASEKQIGMFTQQDPMLDGLTWGNWGSRPYEYYWASTVVSVEHKNVLDLGMGLPSGHTWFSYVVNILKPKHYTGIDIDDRIKNEIVHNDLYDLLWMDMSKLAFNDDVFDIVYCISTFEHIPYDTFMKCIQEAYRVLKNDGVLVITLDEQYDKNKSITHDNSWNILEQSLIDQTLFTREHITFGLPLFLTLIQNYFVPVNDDIVVDGQKNIIFSKTTGQLYYQRVNRDSRILHSPEIYNSCVSYAVLKKVAR